MKISDVVKGAHLSRSAEIEDKDFNRIAKVVNSFNKELERGLGLILKSFTPQIEAARNKLVTAIATKALKKCKDKGIECTLVDLQEWVEGNATEYGMPLRDL